jgi:hypothetical protein
LERLFYNNKTFILYNYSSEAEFEKLILEHSNYIFGKRSAYIDIKKKIGSDIVTIPDGYLIDFSFKTDPKLYIIENELARHDPYKHIGQQLLKFGISYKVSGRRIKKFLLEKIINDKRLKGIVEEGFSEAGYRNIDDFLENLIFEKEISAIVIIDEITESLENVLAHLTMKIDIIEFKTYKCDDEWIHKFTPFQEELKEAVGLKVKTEDLDTIVVPANEEGFNETFLGENRWYAIRISSSMIERIKYIAGYQTAPISAVTYYAEVASIEKYKDTGKYIVNFKDKAKQIGPLIIKSKKKGIAPQAPRYTTYEKLMSAKTIEELFSGM